MIATDIPFRQYADVTGLPLDGGYLYFGQPNQNPETAPITVYWDEAGTQPAAQPIRTINGFAVRSGNIANVYAAADYSLTIKNKNGVTVAYAATSINSSIVTFIEGIFGSSGGASLVGGGVQIVGSIAALRALLKTSASKNAFVTGYYAAGDGGGGAYWYDASDTTSADNGGTIIVAADGGRWKLASTDDIKIRQAGAKVDGVTNDKAAVQTAINAGSVMLPDGTTLINSALDLTVPSKLGGNGARSILKAGAAFPADSILKVSPTVGLDPKGWIIENFHIVNAGAATSAITIDLVAAGKYISKLTVRNVISDSALTNFFVQLINSIPNIDGLFTSVFEDNWSLNGYYLDNAGDSLIFQRNTVSGTTSRAFYINQLATASHIIVRDCNLTSSKGALLVARGYNILFENNQVECPVAYTGSELALVAANNGTGALITNLRISRNNINTQGNTALYCVYLRNTDNAEIDYNSLFCNPATGQHIYIDSTAVNTYIGLNKYFSSVDGTEIPARITDGGIGTMGIWKAPTLATWSTLADPANGFPVGFFKQRDGVVLLRGNLAGTASTAGQTLFTLPVGFRPNSKVYTRATYANGATNNQALLQILPTGEVQFVTAGATTVYLDGIAFSTR